MFRFFSKCPRYEDQGLSDLSRMFFDFPDDPTFRSDLLDRHGFDFGVDSLKHVDRYLESIRHSLPEGEAYKKLILRAGAYVGEVIRRASPGESYHWISYEEAVRISPSFGQLEKSLGSVFALHHGDDSFIFPLGKVCKRLQNGEEDSVWFFAKAIIARQHETKS